MSLPNSVTVLQQNNRVVVTQSTNQVIVKTPGPQGLIGPAGPPGPAASTFYVDEDFTSTSSVVFNHNLNGYPHITVIIDGEEVDADITYNSLNQVTVGFPSPQSGKVVAS